MTLVDRQVMKDIYELQVRQGPQQTEEFELPINEIEILRHDACLDNQSLSQPFLFAVVVLVNPETLEEIHFCQDNQTAILLGSTCSNVHYLLDPEKDSYGAFLVFSDISIRQAGEYKLKIVLTDLHSKVSGLAEVTTAEFNVIPVSNANVKKKLKPINYSKLSRSQWLLDTDCKSEGDKRKVVPPKSREISISDQPKCVKNSTKRLQSVNMADAISTSLKKDKKPRYLKDTSADNTHVVELECSYDTMISHHWSTFSQSTDPISCYPPPIQCHSRDFINYSNLETRYYDHFESYRYDIHPWFHPHTGYCYGAPYEQTISYFQPSLPDQYDDYHLRPYKSVKYNRYDQGTYNS
ncbi:hypothetical protein HDV04_004325 [Boothiomyces sp. JEL0838]|nr:hypothetical protein HDV04_004325 [Boothiomyces sp. JEL0838]